ncbi:MAG: AAA family ATPase [Candidatus Cloacimonetes bacterium]|nr:AAA family ATPase [Candidatus Cloacimonadota bacterium]
MKINSIELRNFRSYQKQKFSFDPLGNLLIGANGCGKTNLLEAIAYTSIGKSIRYHKDDELMAYGGDFFAVEATYTLDNGNTMAVQLSYESGRKSLKLDGVLNRQLSSLVSMVKVILSGSG